MEKENKVKLIEDIIEGIVCSSVWGNEQSANPNVIAATAEMEGLLQAVRQFAPADLMDDLEDSIYCYAGAYERASLLNSLHIADALRSVSV